MSKAAKVAAPVSSILAPSLSSVDSNETVSETYETVLESKK